MADSTLPSVPQQMISTPEALDELCADMRAAGQFAFDTEFIGENSYHPVLCLVQVATTKRVELIDPFAIPDLTPLWKLMADPGVEKICHAGEQDLAIVFQKSGLKTQNIFDSQIGAGMIGLGYPLAYWRLVELFCDVELDKAHTYSAWDRRPLSRQQFAYAVDDVRYLPRIHSRLMARLKELRHDGWMRDACGELATQAAKVNDSRMAFIRLKGANQLHGAQLAALRELAAFREQHAFEHDMPTRSTFKDEVLLDIALRMPQREGDLLAIRSMQKDVVTNYGADLLRAVERGRNWPPQDYPTLPPSYEDSLEVKRVAELLWAMANVICLGQSVTPGLVTSQAEMAALARRVVGKKSLETHVLMSGWHRECIGEPLAKMIRGELAVNVSMKDQHLVAGFAERGDS